MKKTRKTLMGMLIGLLLFAGCDPLYTLSVVNNSDYPVTIHPQKFDGLEAILNPHHSNHPGYSPQVAFPGELVYIASWGRWDKMCAAQDSGYIKVYILDSLTLRDTICTYYVNAWLVRKCNNEIYFPPTEEMRYIKMIPPYGTFDSLGHRRE